MGNENPDFFRWILKADFSKEVKDIAANALRGIFPQKGGVSSEKAPSSEKENKTPFRKNADTGKKPAVNKAPQGLNSLGDLDALNNITFSDEEE